MSNFRLDRVLHAQAADAGSPQCGEVCAAVKRDPEIAGYGADVGAFGTADSEIDFRQFKAGDLEFVDGDVFGG